MSLAKSLYDGRDYESALPIFLEMLDGLRQNAQSAAANFLCGASLVNLQQPDRAIPYLKAALAKDPQLSSAHAALGQALLLAGKPEQAVSELKAALAGDDDGSVRFQLFRAYQLTGNTQLAKQAFADYRQTRASAAERQSMDDGSAITAPPD